MIVAGIDPGKSGALSIIYPDGAVLIYDVPLIETRKPSKTNKAGFTVKTSPAWSDWRRTWGNALEFAAPDLIVIELVTAGQNGVKQGVQSMFNFGRTLGFAHALVPASSRVEFVTPAVWKDKLGLLLGGKGASREKARTLYPRYSTHYERVKDDGRAEATLLAHYGRKFL